MILLESSEDMGEPRDITWSKGTRDLQNIQKKQFSKNKKCPQFSVDLDTDGETKPVTLLQAQQLNQ